MGELVNGYCGTRWTFIIEITIVNFIISLKIVHRNQKTSDFHNVFETGTFCR